MHNVLFSHLLTNVIQPAITNVTQRVLDKMHVTCVKDMLYTHILVLCKDSNNGRETNCCFCGQYVSNPQYVKFVPNPYLMWTNETNCCQPYSLYCAQFQQKYGMEATGEKFPMHRDSSTLLFSVWRVIHLNYFLNVNLTLSGPLQSKPFHQVLLSSLDDCISKWPPCMQHSHVL